MKLLGLTGPKGVGKDTAAWALVAYREWRQYALADPLRLGIKAMFDLDDRYFENGWKETVLPQFGASPRHMMQTLGTEWGRQCIKHDVWIDLAEQVIRESQVAGCPGLVISDIRFCNEADMVRRLGGTVAHVVSVGGYTGGHASEEGVAACYRDEVLTNYTSINRLYESTLDLETRLKDIPKV